MEMPSYSGEPTEWRHFHRLFSSAMDSRGRDFTDHEKVCILLKSMIHPEAQRIVQAHTNSDEGYAEAMKALTMKYGAPRKVFPLLVRKVLEKGSIDFTEEGFAQLRERYLNRFKAMKELGCDSLSQFITAIACEEFTPRLREEWTKHIASGTKVPDLEELLAYAQPLEHTLSSYNLPSSYSGSSSSLTSTSSSAPSSTQSTSTPSSSTAKVGRNCPLCNESHKLIRCPVFLGYDAPRNKKYLKSKKGSTNCLSLTHQNLNCTSSYNCRKCNGRHHTLLHMDDSPSATPQSASTLMSTPSSSTPITTKEEPPKIAFLHTALVQAVNGDRDCTARAALDTGSSSSLVTEKLASQLRLKHHPQRLSLSGAYGEGTSKHHVSVTLRSLHDSTQTITFKLSVIQRLPQAFPPNRKEEIAAVPHLKDLTLADPAFGGPLDILIGSLDYGRCVRGTLTYSLTSDLAALPTLFGWTVTGPLDYQPPTSTTLKIGSSDDTLAQDLSRLWELEGTPEAASQASAEDISIAHFKETHRIDQEGRYLVALPRISNPPELGSSRNIAVQRFLSNENSLKRKGKLEEFNKALQEYLTLGHAEVVPSNELHLDHYYLPIHGVFKDSSTTTKVRPVFDASARTSTGASLNDTLERGPNLYPLLTDILLRFQNHAIAYSADISKMFLEIKLQPQERDLHRFLNRNQAGKLVDCRMTRVTFGVRCSPFLATQVIRDLAVNHSESHPEASRTILESFYVDDYISGSSTLEEAIHL